MREMAFGWAAVAVLATSLVASTEAQQQARQRRSPHETTQATVGGAQISVEYGRPYLKGRTIGKEIVPFNQVWRTGADEATTLKTDKTLQFGSATVPAGTYTLYTLPTEDKWTLIVNKQTGQWGTVYDEKQDLLRIPLQKKPAAPPTEQFTIKVEQTGDKAGRLVLAWGDQEYAAPFTVQG